MPTPPIPGWKDPVATGMRCPIFREAFWPSSARICGCWRILVLLSLYRKLAVAGGMVTWKFVAFRCAKLLRLITPGWLPVVVVTDPLDRKSTRLNSSHLVISYAVFCLKKKKNNLNLNIYKKKKNEINQLHPK